MKMLDPCWKQCLRLTGIARCFVFQWFPDLPDYATTVEINFVPAEGGTIIRLHEYGYADTASGRTALISCAAGWGEALTLLKIYMEHGLHY
jgi:hypothetical protein